MRSKSNLKLFVTLLALAVVTSQTMAHEGDHGTPGLVEAPKGGEIKSLGNVHVEVLTQGAKDIKIYLYTKDLKPIAAAKGFRLTAQAEVPRVSGRRDLLLKESGGVYTTTFDSGKAHRYTLHITVYDPDQKYDDHLSFTIEPRR